MGGEVVTRDAFDVQLGRLIVLRGWPDSADEHFKALRDIPEPVFTAAVDLALRTRAWFPVPAELRADADIVARSLATPMEPEPEPPAGEAMERFIANPFGGDGITVTVHREWRHDCDRCADTGRASRWCGDRTAPQRKPWYEIRTCDHRGEHGAHEWVETCVCVEWNPTIKRRNASQQQSYSKAPVKV